MFVAAADIMLVLSVCVESKLRLIIIRYSRPKATR